MGRGGDRSIAPGGLPGIVEALAARLTALLR